MNLFCIPYAGGSAKIIYNSWQKYVSNQIRIKPLELAGHGIRMNEPFYPNIDTAVSDLFSEIRDSINQTPYAIYGHSMGSLIAYELIKKISIAGLPQPKTLFLSGRRPPHNCPKPRNIHRFSDNLLLEEMKKLGGTPKTFFEVKDLVNTFLPIFRNDYRMLESYKFTAPIHTTTADIVFFHSDRDSVVAGTEVNEWLYYTSGQFNRIDFTGDHFFINDNREKICGIIQQCMEYKLAEIA